MKKILIILMAFYCYATTKAQVNLDSIQIERIVKTSQLWGHLKYFHPYLSDNSIDWESAFCNNIEQVISSKSSEEFGETVQKMLDQLNDPATQVLMDNDINVVDDSVKYPLIEFIQDSILFVSIKDHSDLDDFIYAYEQFVSLKEKIPLSNGVIFDIRSLVELGDNKGTLSWYFANIERSFSSEEIQFPGLTARFHDGFAAEIDFPSGGYYSGFYTKGEKKIAPGPAAVEKPIVFIVNEHADIPMIALALQMAGKAKIISTGPITDASIVESLYYKLDDSLEVAIRQNVLPSGVALNVDYFIPPNTEETEIIHMALQLIKGEKITKTPFQNKESEPTTGTVYEFPKNPDDSYPDLGHRFLAAAKIWTVIDYFFAYKDLMEEDWDEVLRKFIPRVALATDSLEYHLAIAEMYNNIQDGHGFKRSKVLIEYFDQASPPIKIRFIEEQPVVTGLLHDSVFEVRGVDVGDIILAIDGENAKDRFNRYAKFITSSNQSGLKNSISRVLLNGNDSTDITLKIRKEDGKIETVVLPRNKYFNQNLKQMGNDRNNEPITRLINENIGYADLDRLTTDMVDQMFDDFKDTKAIIFDMRGYPNGTAWEIAPHLTNKDNVYAANFRRYTPMGINIGEAKHMAFFNQAIPPPELPTYNGQTVMLIDERTQSQAEHTGLFFEAANGTKFIGSQTAGANGDVTAFPIPGNIILYFSGADVRHIDGKQLQKIGLVPDIHVKPTIEGIRKDKDEVLEKAIEYIESEIQK